MLTTCAASATENCRAAVPVADKEKRDIQTQMRFAPRMMFPRILPFLLLAVAASVLSPARAAEFAGEIGDGTALFLPDGLSPDALPASLALIAPPKVRGPLPAGWSLRPEFSRTDAGKSRVTLNVPTGTSLYGEGEVTGPLLRNGTDTVLWNTDNGAYAMDGGRRLYQSHPWIMGVRPDGTAFGLIADTTYHAEIRLTDALIDFVSDGPAFPVIILDRASPQDLMHALAGLIGTLPLPPRWALGYHQCRYSYEPDSRVREIADGFRAHQIPCDVIWMDIDYMDHYKIFTFDPQKFPDPHSTNDYLHAHGFHSVWMIDPGAKAEPGYGVFDSGTAANVWMQDAAGDAPYHGKVWPGDCVFPDFTRPETRAWWGGLYKDFLAQGVDGVWNDMNEPAVFGTPDHTADLAARHRGGGGLPAGTEAQYHNVFGMLEVRATREGIAAAHPDRRPFVLSRAGFLGSQRYGATWTGDNVSKWEHLKMSIPMSLNLGLSGQPMSGPDIGGFIGKATPDLWANWIAVGAYFPFCRGHSSKGTPDKEPWAFGPETEEVARTSLDRRYRLLPYLYTLFRENEQDGMPVMRPVFFADPKDPALRAEEQAFLVGGDVLIVPAWAQQPAMPPGDWQSIFTPDKENADPADAYQPQVRLRPGAILPLGNVVQSTAEDSLKTLGLVVNLDASGRATGTLYEDAGDGYGYQHGDYLLTTYTAERQGDTVTVRVAKTAGNRPRPARSVTVSLLYKGKVFVARGKEAGEMQVKLAAE